MSNGWIGVDLDGTLAHYDSKQYPAIGDPIPAMVRRVKKWLSIGINVKIVTARAAEEQEIGRIRNWCHKHIGEPLTVTNMKDFEMIELWDDRAVQIIPNTGIRADGKE